MTQPISLNVTDVINRLHERTVYDDKTGCWLYIGAKSARGYGNLKVEGRYYYVHRLSAWIFLKLDLNDRTKHSLHKNTCPHKHCWNWHHLYVGDNCDNAIDRERKKKERKNACD